MEIDSNLPGDKASDVSDEMRLDASTRLRTLEPIHSDIAANELPEETVVSQDILKGPIANVSNDSESTTPPANQGSQVAPHKKVSLTMTLTALIVIIAAGAAAMFVFIH